MRTSTKTHLFFHKIKTIINYWPLIGLVASLVTTFIWAWSLLCTPVFAYFMFKGTMNILQGAGPVYWITRNNSTAKVPFIAAGVMRETGHPWRMGKGVQVTYRPYAFQIGFCKKILHSSMEDGELYALGARYMDTPPKELGEWK